MVAQKIGFTKTIIYSQLNLGLAHLRLGDRSAARQVLEQALTGAAGVDHFAFAVGSTYLGLAAEAAGEPAAAHQHFAEAWQRLDTLDMPGNGQDALAGLARSSLSAGEAGQALEYTRGVWEYLVENGAQALEFPILAYQTCAQVFAVAGDPASGENAIRRGYQELQERAQQNQRPSRAESLSGEYSRAQDDIPLGRTINQYIRSALLFCLMRISHPTFSGGKDAKKS